LKISGNALSLVDCVSLKINKLTKCNVTAG